MAAPPPVSLGTAPAKVHIIGRDSSDGGADGEFDSSGARSDSQHADGSVWRKASLESTRSFYNLPPVGTQDTASHAHPLGVGGRHSPTPSQSSFYHQLPGSRTSAHSLTSPSSHTSALPHSPSATTPSRPAQSAFTSGVLPARGFFSPQKPGDARRTEATRASETAALGVGGAVEMVSPPSKSDPKPFSASETSFGLYSSRQPSEEGPVDPETRGLRIDPSQAGDVGYKGSQEPLIHYPRKPMSGKQSPDLSFGGTPKLSLNNGFGGSPKARQEPAFASNSPRLGSSGTIQRRAPAPAPPQPSPTTAKRVKAYTLHEGRNGFALGGKLITGGDASPFPLIASLVIEVGVGAVWVGTTGARIWQHGVSGDGGRGGIAVVIIFLWIWGMSFGAMMGTAFRDPGIIPRNLDPSPPLAPTRSTQSLVPLPRELRVRAGKVTVKYCDSCKIYRPPRASHCRICDNCVDGIDHHCAYLHTCVGRNNYTSFLAFLFFSVLSLLYAVIWSAVYLWRTSVARGQSFKHTLAHEAGSAVVFCLGLLFLAPVGSLMSYHFWLMLNNSTTIEEIRRTAQRSLAEANPKPPSRFHKLLPCLATVRRPRRADEDGGNPFTFGRWWTNLSRGLCRPRVGSWMGFDEWVEVPLERREEK